MMLKTERLMIRDFTDNDKSFYMALEQDKHTYLYESDNQPTDKELNKNFEEILMLQTSDKRIKYSFIVERTSDNEPVGRLVMWEIDHGIQEWEMGWMIAKEYTGNGYASEASKALLLLGFKRVNANRICANCNDANLSSENVMINIGMKKEGLLRATRKLNNQWYGSTIYAMVKDDLKGGLDE